jgi:hypothetical protein
VGNFFSEETHETYDVRGPNGEECARFERFQEETNYTETFGSAMGVSCSRSSLTPEQCLTFAFALLHEGTKSSGSTSHMGGE